MESSTIAAIAAFAGALLALALYHLVAVGPSLRRLRRTSSAHDTILGAGETPGAGRLSSLEKAAAATETRSERVEQRLQELERVSRTDLARVGFIRFNAFTDTGSELSYALALLNREGDGVVLSSIFSREDTRTFGKAVRAYKPLQDASKEELRAIEQARGENA
ncbi:MAG: DUF4446 family protein [Candidatus Eremiobacteraeota bacterium]|nr:DUF4446 family protein [Candidatus Eremiobacteraeota bacterium]